MQNEINRPLLGADQNQEMFTFTLSSFSIRGFPGGSVVKNPPAKQEMQGTWIWSLGLEDPLEKDMATHSSILDRGAWQATIHGVAKSWTRLSNWARTTVFATLAAAGNI